jgi:hypothetical protein
MPGRIHGKAKPMYVIARGLPSAWLSHESSQASGTAPEFAFIAHRMTVAGLRIEIPMPGRIHGKAKPMYVIARGLRDIWDRH